MRSEQRNYQCQLGWDAKREILPHPNSPAARSSLGEEQMRASGPEPTGPLTFKPPIPNPQSPAPVPDRLARLSVLIPKPDT